MINVSRSSPKFLIVYQISLIQWHVCNISFRHGAGRPVKASLGRHRDRAVLGGWRTDLGSHRLFYTRMANFADCCYSANGIVYFIVLVSLLR